MQVDIKDTVMDIVNLKSTDIRNYFNKYKVEQKFICTLNDKMIDSDHVDDRVIYKCKELSPKSKDYISIKWNLIRALLSNMDRTEKMWDIYARGIDKKNIELSNMIKEIILEVKEYKKSCESCISIHSSIEQMDIKNLQKFNIPNEYFIYANNNGIKKLGDLRYDINFLENYASTEIKEALESKLEDFALKIVALDNRSYNILNEYYTNEKTLEEVGNEFGLTKQRIAQIILKERVTATQLLEESLNARCIDMLDLDDCSEIFINILLDDRKLDLLNLYIINDTILNKFRKLEDSIHEIISDSLWKEDIGDKLRNRIESLELSSFIDVDIIFKKLNRKNSGYRCSKDAIIAYKNISNALADIRSQVIKYYYPNGVFISQYNIDNIVNLTNEIAGKNKDNSPMFVKNILNKMYILRDKNTYIHPDLVHLSDSMQSKIKEYALQRKGIDLIYGVVFRLFKDELIKDGIDNEYYLHGAMSKYLSDTLDIRARSFSVKGYESKDIVDILENISYEEKRVVNLSELERIIDKEYYKALVGKINKTDTILNYGEYNVYSVRNLDIDSIEKANIRKIIDQYIKDDILDCDELYNEKDSLFCKTMLDAKITNSMALKNLIKYVFSSEFDRLPGNNNLIRV